MTAVFFSYTHKDEALRDQLEAHLSLLKNQGLIDVWHDRRIGVGTEVDDSIFSQMEAADIILLLVSADFLASAYCYSREMTRAMERHNAGEAKVIPVILRACDWHSAPFGKLLAAPRDGKPVTSWPDRDEALADVAKQVREAVAGVQINRHDQAEALPRQALIGVASSFAPKSLPRSSNLRLKKEFTDKDMDDFLQEAFEFICKFFEGSLLAINERNPQVNGRYERIDSRRMVAKVYKAGKTVADCAIRLEGGRTRSGGVAYSHDSSASSGSYNEMLSISSDDQSLYLKAMGMSWNGEGSQKRMSPEGAAEFLWAMFIDRLQT